MGKVLAAPKLLRHNALLVGIGLAATARLFVIYATCLSDFFFWRASIFLDRIFLRAEFSQPHFDGAIRTVALSTIRFTWIRRIFSFDTFHFGRRKIAPKIDKFAGITTNAVAHTVYLFHPLLAEGRSRSY